jgi:PhzF family phenazine biosynthesis protein
MQNIALENNLRETAYFVPNGNGYDLRWFTPTIEMDLCGHATLPPASSYLKFLGPIKGFCVSKRKAAS